jgi:hypothetical protein
MILLSASTSPAGVLHPYPDARFDAIHKQIPHAYTRTYGCVRERPVMACPYRSSNLTFKSAMTSNENLVCGC